MMLLIAVLAKPWTVKPPSFFKGLAIFDDIARYDTVLPSAEFYNKSYRGQMKIATRAIQMGEINPGIFTPEQLNAINAGKPKIPDYTWHHHQHHARMQLVPSKKHLETGHIGGEALSKGGNKYVRISKRQ